MTKPSFYFFADVPDAPGILWLKSTRGEIGRKNYPVCPRCGGRVWQGKTHHCTKPYTGEDDL